MKIDYVNHDSAVYRYLKHFALADVKGIFSVLMMIKTHQKHKFLTAVNKISQYFVPAQMVFKREDIKKINFYYFMEL